MRAQRLQNLVTVEGKNLTGRDARVLFRPTSSAGWQMRFAKGPSLSDPIRVDPSVLRLGLNSLSIEREFEREGRYVAHIVEHLLALRLGLQLYDGVEVIISEGGIPFTGHSQHFLEAIAPAIITQDKNPPCYTTAEVVRRCASQGKRSVEFRPSTTGELILSVTVDYAGIGTMYGVWNSTHDTFDEIADARGELKPVFHFLVGAAGACGWPHKDAFADVRRMEQKEWLSNLARHRIIDALGALACVMPRGKLSGTYVCNQGGHREDVQLVRAMARSLVEVRELSQVA